jgi:hypothetical protein
LDIAVGIGVCTDFGIGVDGLNLEILVEVSRHDMPRC